jgi:serine/threonine protein kinase
VAQLAPSAYGPLWVARVASGAEDGRIVALRRVGKGPLLDDAALARTATAAFAAMDARHPRIVAVLDVVLTKTELGIVTEYVEGELLSSLQRRAGLGNKPFELSVALRLVLDAVHAAIAARDAFRAATAAEPSLRNAVHGGLSPDSLLVASYGEVLLLDVGITGVVLGRPETQEQAAVLAYRAPEQILTGVADERADVFTLGTLLWELALNRPLFGSPKWPRWTAPHDGESPSSDEAARTRRKVLDMPVPRLDAVVRAGARVPRDVAAIAARALERDPDRRFPSLEALRSALEALGSERFAPPEAVTETLLSLAGTSLEARRHALSMVTGRQLHDGAPIDSLRPTLPPRPADSGPPLPELASSPEAVGALGAQIRKPPPLPKRAGNKAPKTRT